MKDIEFFVKKYNIPFIPSLYEPYKKFLKEHYTTSDEVIFKKYKAWMKLPAFKNFTFEDSQELEISFKGGT